MNVTDFHMIHTKRSTGTGKTEKPKKKRKNRKRKKEGGLGNLLCVHNIQKYPGVRSYLTFTTAQEPTKVQCTNNKKNKQNKKEMKNQTEKEKKKTVNTAQ